MDSNEPTLAPQWLRSSRHVTNFATASSPLLSDNHAPSKLANSRSLSDNKVGHPAASDRAISSHNRWSPNSSSSPDFRPYSSFRSHRNRDMDRDINKYREKSTLGNHRSRDLPDTSRKDRWEIFEEERSSPSQSATSGRISGKWPRNLSNAGKTNLTDNNGLLASVSGVDSLIDRGIRLVGTEVGQASPGVGSVRSPGLGTMTQNLPTGASGPTCNKSASALADVTQVIGNNNAGFSSLKQAASSGPPSPISSKGISRGLNMAETVAKGPPCAQATSQSSNANQRLEELAMKQSRQLIPLKPLVAKPSVPYPSDKPRTRVEPPRQTVSSSHPASLSSKLHVFKPTRQTNGVSGVNSSLSPNAYSKGPNTLRTSPTSPSTQDPATDVSSSTPERKPVGTMVEKKRLSQARSRNDFFNLMRKKSMASTSSDDGAGRSVSPSLDKSGVSEVLTAPQDHGASLSDESPRVEKSSEILGENTCNSDSFNGNNSTTESFPKSDAILCSEEEEAALLRSMGWEENADEGCLTEEEISAFLTEYSEAILSLKVVQGVQTRFMLPLHSGMGDVGGISS